MHMLLKARAQIFQCKTKEAYAFTPKVCDHGGFDLLSSCSSCDEGCDEQIATSMSQPCVPTKSMSTLQKPLEVIGVDTDEDGSVLSNVLRGPLDNGCNPVRHVDSQ